ncbi:MAG: GerMN domain-containing protein [Spirochaetales bacterium]|nr:GerMN domain-containing protein [Spirochaetales bacterium]
MKKKKSSIGCLFWIALILLIIVIFLFSRTRIEKVMDNTGFLDFLSSERNRDKPEVDRIIVEQNDSEEQINTIQTPENTVPEPVQEVTINVQETKSSVEKMDQPVVEKNIRTSILYFVNVNNEENISLQGISRPVYYDDSPLTATLTALLAGLTSSELNKGLLSLIPQGTEIKGITISNGTATIDFNESLSFNSFGKEGLESELKQIIFTATEFPTVDKVQILINGQKKQFLSTEGVFIGDPLTRSSVQ